MVWCTCMLHSGYWTVSRDKIFIDDNGTHVNDNDDDNDESHDDG